MTARAQRICAQPGCNTTTDERHCDQHRVNLSRDAYNHRWRTHIRPAVLSRDNYRCAYCGMPAKQGQPLDVAHTTSTQQLLRNRHDPHDVALLVAAHRKCHNANAARPPENLGGAGQTVGVDGAPPLPLASSGDEIGASFSGSRVFYGAA